MKISTAAERYTWRQLARRAGINFPEGDVTGFEQLGLSVHYGSPDDAPRSPALIVCRSKNDDRAELLTLPPQDLRWIPSNEVIPPGASLPFDNLIPVLVWGEHVNRSTAPFAEKLPNGSLVFYADILAATLFMLSRWEETDNYIWDVHSRFPASASTASRLGFLDIPIVDQYAIILREWLKLILPEWMPEQSTPTVKLSHDIDAVVKFSTVRGYVKSIGNALLKQRSLARAWSHLTALPKQVFFPDRDIYFRSIYTLAETSAQIGYSSSFYFMAAKPGQYQRGYNISSNYMRKCFHDLLRAGHEIGFHPSYHTLEDPSLFLQEKRTLEATTGRQVFSGRQHYLRFNVPMTWRMWESAGMRYESSMGYPDQEGFRCGTCWSYQPFDLEQDREIIISEVPLVVMDATLFHYRKMNPAEARTRILFLARRCAQVGGTFTLLWHNTSLSDEWKAWFEEYKKLLPQLKTMFSVIAELKKQ